MVLDLWFCQKVKRSGMSVRQEGVGSLTCICAEHRSVQERGCREHAQSIPLLNFSGRACLLDCACPGRGCIQCYSSKVRVVVLGRTEVGPYIKVKERRQKSY